MIYGQSPNGVQRFQKGYIVVRHDNINADGLPTDPADLILLIQTKVADFLNAGSGMPVVEIVTEVEPDYDNSYTAKTELHFGAKRPATKEEITDFLKWEDQVKNSRKQAEIAQLENRLAALKGS